MTNTVKKSITHKTIKGLYKIIEVVSIRDTKKSIWVKPLKTETDDEGSALTGADGKYLYKRAGDNFDLFFTPQYQLPESMKKGSQGIVEFDEVIKETEGKISKCRFTRDLTWIRNPKEGDKE